MSKTFQFRQKPEHQYSKSQVVVSLQDFEQLVEFAENWMNMGSTSSGSPNGYMMNQQVNINQFCVCQGHQQSLPTLGNPKWTPAQSGLDALAQVAATSYILNSEAGKKLGTSPLEFLSFRLPKFKKAKRIFATRDLMPRTAMAAPFHSACDHVPDVLVIIKSGQYIAGGYTEVPFESPASGFSKPNPNDSTFVYSANRRKLYALQNRDNAIYCAKSCGPYFGNCGLCIYDDLSKDFLDDMYNTNSSYYESSVREGELFGARTFKADEYEVYKLE